MQLSQASSPSNKQTNANIKDMPPGGDIGVVARD